MTIESIKELQNNIFLLNESCNKKKLMIPKGKAKNEQFNLFNKLKLFFEKLSLESFTTSKDVLHPNLIAFLINNKICTINRDINKNKIICYLQSICPDHSPTVKVYISKQIYFGYVFVELLKRYRKKKHMKHFFDEDNYIQNLKMEEWTRTWNGVKNTRRLDFLLDIGNDRKIVIEYLEDHHMEELKDWNLYQSIRLVDILFGDMKDSIVHFAFVWDKLFDNKYAKKKAKNIVEIIKNFHDIDNEKQYTINVLDEYINKKKLSTTLVNVFINENNPILNVDDIYHIFEINKSKKQQLNKRFLDMVKELNKSVENDLDSDSEDSDNENSYFENNVNQEIYFKIENDNLLLSDNGLFLYLDLLTYQDINTIEKYKFKIRFIDRIGKAAYESSKRIRELVLKQKENLISGLEEIN